MQRCLGRGTLQGAAQGLWRRDKGVEASSPSGEALGARGAGRFFAFGLLVGVMPYQGWRGLAAVSLCSCSGVLFWVATLSSSSSSSSSKGLYGLGSGASDLLSSLLLFPTPSPSSSSEVLLGVSWLLPGGGGGAGFFLGSACTKAIHGGSLALAAAPALGGEKERSRWQGAEASWDGEAQETDLALRGKDRWSRMSPMQKQLSHPRVALVFPRHSVLFSMGKPMGLREAQPA